MHDYTRIISLVAEINKAITAGDHDLAEVLGLELVDVFESDFNIKGKEDYSPEAVKLQFDIMATMIDLHIMRGDPLDIAIHVGQVVKEYEKHKELLPEWTDDDWAPVHTAIDHVIESTNAFMYKSTVGNQPQELERNAQCRCMLCGNNKADKTGSHMVPHFLIAKTFSYDGSTERERVVVEEANLAEGKKSRYFGHEVYDETVQELLGRSFTDEEIEAEIAKKNALTRDYYFCSDCEKRFGVIESYYAEIIEGKTTDAPPQIPYLFWLSVAWRMSVGGMGFKMMASHEDKLRKILNHCLALKREDIVIKQSKLGYCAYQLFQTQDTRDETIGILAYHVPTKPYMALIGNRLFRFFVSKTAAISFSKRTDWKPEKLNFGDEEEKIVDMPFIDFWLAKRQILDSNWEEERNLFNMGQKRNKTLTRYESFVGEHETEIPVWMNSTDGRVIMEPRAISKIKAWIKQNKDNPSLEKLIAETGYSKEELEIILSYWHDKCDKFEEKHKKNEDMMSLVEYLFDDVL